MTRRFIVLHGHFYQPPRADPWYEEVARQPSAWPEHDWNERVTEECYAPNTAARLRGADGRVHGFVDAYAGLSFDFGPTLMEWLERHAEEVYAAVLAADRDSRHRLGHGNALAQAHGHLIMPLATDRDRHTQVIWGMADFAARFGRDPEGMWLPETAVDTATLEVLAEHGIAFTVLAPSQAARVRSPGKPWQAVRGDIDGRSPCRVHLPSGRSIDVFFYDGGLSRGIAFEGLLRSGERLVAALLGAFDDDVRGSQLVHAATDGETYGHHHRFGDMALAYALDALRRRDDVQLTNYAAYLAANPPSREVAIRENSSWSCVHGVERWRSDCGCHTGGQPGWNQQWRAPLREALDELARGLAAQFEQHAGRLLRDPWQARDVYLAPLLADADADRGAWLRGELAPGLDARAGGRALAWLESQRHAMAMFTSCGWFFNDLSGIETEQVLLHAARALQLAREAGGEDLEPALVESLRQASSNRPEVGTAADLWVRRIAPRQVTRPRVAAAAALATLLGLPRGRWGAYDAVVRLQSAAGEHELRATVTVRDGRDGGSDELLAHARVESDELVSTVQVPGGGATTWRARSLPGVDGSWLLDGVLRREEASVLRAQRALLRRAAAVAGAEVGAAASAEELPVELRSVARVVAEADLRDALADPATTPAMLETSGDRLRHSADRRALDRRSAGALRDALAAAAADEASERGLWLRRFAQLARLRRELAPEVDSWRAQRRVYRELSRPPARQDERERRSERELWLELANLLDVHVPEERP